MPSTHDALQHTAEDLRLLGRAAKTDLQRLQQDAQELARTRVIEPGVRMVDEAYGYVVENPGRALLGAAIGGFFLGLLVRR